MKLSSSEQEKFGGYGLLVIMLLVFFGLLLKNAGLFPFIFGDEYTYSLHSRLLPLSESPIPGYLYLAVYRLTNHCEVDFLGCARTFNAFFFVCAAPFIYLICRRMMAVLPALCIALCALLAPINAYTAHYMPEALYFFGFWAFIWALTRARIEVWQDWLVAGLLLGCSSLIKPHSMLFIPAATLYIGYVSIAGHQGRLLLAARNLGLFFIAAALAKFALSYALAGPAGLTLFGTSYNKIASNAGGLERVIQLTSLALKSLQGHLLGICLGMGLALAATVHLSIQTIFTRRPLGDAEKFAVLSALIVANLVLATSLFSATVIGVSPNESIYRVHARYYDFAFPMLWMVVASVLSRVDVSAPRKWRAVLAVMVAAAIIYALINAMAPYEPSIIDSPELEGLLFDKTSFYLIAAAGLLTLVAWVYRQRAGATLFVYLALPLTVIVSSYWVTQEQRIHLTPTPLDRAGTFTRQYLDEQQRTATVLVGADMGALMNAAFYLSIPRPWPFLIARDIAYDFQGLAPELEWMLSIGDYVPPADGRLQMRMPGFTLTKIHPASEQ